MESGDYEKAITLLSAAYEKLPFLGDYALLWRARAYEGTGHTDRALEDVRALKEKYKESPLIKKAELKEIELLKKSGDPAVSAVYENVIKEYPSDLELKYAYAKYLKETNNAAKNTANNSTNNTEKSKRLFKEVFIAACPLSAYASNELSPSDITVDDLIKRGKNLNTAWQFEEAEKVFREALKLDKGPLKDDITDSLAYSLFRQKRYKEAADLYKDTKNNFWRARAIFRAGDMDAFKAELPEFIGISAKTPDKRLAAVIMAYGASRRREGNTDEALKIFNTVLAHYPAAKEDALWSIGWTYYMSRDYKSALKIFSRLASTYTDSKYSYWNRKCSLLAGENKDSDRFFGEKTVAVPIFSHDFYSYLHYIKGNKNLSSIAAAPLKRALNPRIAERVDTLSQIGLVDEATGELLALSRKNPAPGDLISFSAYLESLGNYNTAVALITRLPYSEELHNLYYPLAFWPEVEEASKATSLDPFLILSVMREESRFAPDARSIAGAIGLMQLMPQTARQYNKHNKAHLANPQRLSDARTNILLGSYYLKQLLNKFGSVPLALASYNGGEDAVTDWLKKGNYKTIDEFIEDIPYDETRNYVKRVMTTYFEYLRSNRNGDVTVAHNAIGEL